MIDDWEKWMSDHHIRLRGDPRDSRANANKSLQGISQPKVETKSNGDGRRPCDSHIQKYARRGKART